jgi:hypothetical protein
MRNRTWAIFAAPMTRPERFVVMSRAEIEIRRAENCFNSKSADAAPT